MSYLTQLARASDGLMIAVMNYHRPDITRMLGLWESECEAVAVFREGVMEGLAFAGDLDATVIIASHYPGIWSDMPGVQTFPVDMAFQTTDSPCGECHLGPGEVCDICGARQR